MKTTGRLTRLQRPVQLLSRLLQGTVLDRQSVAEMLGVKLAAADRQLRALAELKGVKRARQRGKTLYSFEPPVDQPTLASVVAAGLGASFARLFEGSAYMTGMRVVRDELIARAPRRHRFRRIDRKLLFLLQGGEQALHRDDNPLDEVIEGLLEEKELRLYYEDFHGRRERIVVRPLSLMVYRQQLYLVALKGKETLHLYRVARILSVRLGEPFAYPPDYDPDAVYRDSFGVFIPSQAPVAVRVRLSDKWRTFVKSHRWHPSQSVEEDGVTVRLTVCLCEELEQWILGFGEDAEVLEPAALRTKIASRVRAAASQYRG